MNQQEESAIGPHGQSYGQAIARYMLIGIVLLTVIYFAFSAKNNVNDADKIDPATTVPAISQSGTPPATQTADAPQQTPVKITYTSSGFSPLSVTVKSGSKITWVNASSGFIAIGVDPHPFHVGNKEISDGLFTLDLQPGEEKTVVVSKTGTFGYHNHVEARMTGSITVE